MTKNIFFILLLTFSFTSCKKFLEEVPKDQVTESTFYKTDDDVEAAVDGIYIAARAEAGQGLPIMFPLEGMSDDGGYSTAGNFQPPRAEIDLYTFTSVNTVINSAWSRPYTVINRANGVIKFATDSVNIRPSVIRKAHAQARFFRAYYHFVLTQMFGDVPLMKEPASVVANNIFPSRTATKKVYESVIEDLLYAEKYLDTAYAYSGSDGGRVTVAAAKALLGKVYLTMAGYPLKDPSGYQLAIDELKDLIDNRSRYGIALNPVFANIFTSVISTKALDRERIYFIRGTNGLPVSANASTGMGWTFRTFRYTSPTKDFAVDQIPSRRIYETNDLRRVLTAGNVTLSTVNTALVGKYNSTNNTDASDDLILLRYAEVLMMTAEALIEIGGTANLDAALALINQVRAAHGGTAIPALTYTDQNDLREKYRLESRREFAFECKRWFNLKRWDILLPTVQASLADYYSKPISEFSYIQDPTFPNKYKVLPIPITEVSNNANMTQNDGF
jgi:hypothetical protein